MTMAESSKAIRSFCANYCDDIRLEVGNKISLIGIYGTDLRVAELPAMIPKLCVYAQIYSELDTVFDEDVEVKVLLDDDVITSSVRPPKSEATLQPKQFQKIGFHFVISPFLIEKECILRTRAFYKGVEYRSSALMIKATSTPVTESIEP